VPKGNGHSEFFRAQLAISLILVVKKLSPTADSVAMLYSLSSAASVVGRIELAKIIAVIGARLESYRPDVSESNSRALESGCASDFRAYHLVRDRARSSQNPTHGSGWIVQAQPTGTAQRIRPFVLFPFPSTPKPACGFGG